MKKSNVLKKLMMAALIFALLVPVMGNLKTNLDEVHAAEETDLSEVLSVRCQVTEGAVTDTSIDQYRNHYVLRFVSSVDGLNYKNVGFEISYEENGETIVRRNTTKTVFKRIASETGMTEAGRDTYTFGPKIISTDSEYFITAKWPVSQDQLEKNYTVKAFVITAEGEYIYGPERCVCANDGLSDTTVNLSFDKAADATVDTLTVNGASATVIGTSDDGTRVHTRFTVADKKALPSATQYTFTNGEGTTVGSEIYRNLYTKYTGTADKSWYETYYKADSTETEFVIVTSADLYGFAELSKTLNFSGKTIYLASDIKANDATLVTDPTDSNYKMWASYDAETSNTVYAEAPSYSWTSIGNTTAFYGIFDGQMHTISGVYCLNNSYTGLFGYAQANSKIRNLKLTDSYFSSTNTRTGSIAGRVNTATLSNVYSNAIVEGTQSYIGGLVGLAQTVTIEKCWYDGAVTSNVTDSKYQGTGGFLGVLYSGTLTMSDCLNTGNVDVSAYTATSCPCAGGFVGWIEGGTTANISYCLNAADIAINEKTTLGYGYITGYEEAKSTMSKENVYSTTGSWSSDVVSASTQNANITQVSEDALHGNSIEGFDFDSTWTSVTRGVPVLDSLKTVVVDDTWYDEDKDIFVLYDKADLNGLAELSQTINFAGKTIKLGNDIVVNTGSATEWTTKIPRNEWTPIGTKDLPFAGTFDGDMYTISGLYLNDDSANNGFFGATGNASTVRNFHLKNSYFTSTGTDLGSIAGQGRGLFDTISSDAIVTGANARVGGLLGMGYGTDVVMQYCQYEGTVTNTSNAQSLRGTGGLMGALYSSGAAQIKDCLNMGVVNVEAATMAYPKAGGFVGDVQSGARLTLANSVAVGEIQASSTSSKCGIFVGVIDGGVVTSNTSYGTGYDNVIGYKQNGAKFTVNYIYSGSTDTSDKSTQKETVGNVPVIKSFRTFTGTAAATSLENLDFTNTWKTTETTPVLNFERSSQDADTRWYNANETEYVLYDEGDLKGLAQLGATNKFAGKTIKLGRDIDVNQGVAANWGTYPLDETDSWTPIGSKSVPFEGTFDGNLYTISGLYFDRTGAYSGLFGATGTSSIIKNVRLTNSYFASSGREIGSIAGRGQGRFDTIYSDAVVVGSSPCVGGIVGMGNGTNILMQYCQFDGTVINPTNSMANRGTGGIMGTLYNNSVVQMNSCLNNGTVDVTAFTNPVPKAGGIIGEVATGSTMHIQSSLSLGDVNAYASSWDGLIAGYIKSASVRCSTSYAIGTEGTDYIVGWMEGTNPSFEIDYIFETKLTSNEERYSTTSKTSDATNGYRSIPIMFLTEDSIIGENAESKLAGLQFDAAWVVTDSTPILNFQEECIDTDTRWYNEWYQQYGTDFIIYDVDDLYGFAELAKTYNFAGKTVKLNQDFAVNYYDTGKWVRNIPQRNWTPIGSKAKPFAGTFDGQMYTISGLSLESDSGEGGLFGRTNEASTIQNLKLTKSNIQTGGSFTGSIVGYGMGALDTIYSDATVSSSKGSVGGLVGLAYGKKNAITNSWFAGTVTNTSNATGERGTGGILGTILDSSVAKLDNCLNTGTVNVATYTTNQGSEEEPNIAPIAGGLVGYVRSKATVDIQYSLSTKNIEVDSSATGFYGPIVGYTANTTGTTIDATYATVDNSKGSKYTGYVFEVTEDYLTGYNAYEYSLLDFNTNWAVVENGTPILKDFASTIPSLDSYVKTIDISWRNDAEGTEGNPYLIADVEDLYGLRVLSEAPYSLKFKGEYIQLAADITVNDGVASEWAETAPANVWTPIGSTSVPFEGTFDGALHTIQGIYLNNEIANSGLFASTGASSTIKNLYLKNSYFKSTAVNLGSIAGQAQGVMDCIYSDAIVSSDSFRVGGLVGMGHGDSIKMNKCWFAGNVENTTNDPETRGTGGLMGVLLNGASAEITNCLNAGVVDVTAYVTDQNAGTETVAETDTSEEKEVNIAPIAGGIIGWFGQDASAKIRGCLNTGEIKVVETATGGYGPLVGYNINGAPTIYECYATNESCTMVESDEISSLRPTMVDAASITGEAATTNMSMLDWTTDWQVADGALPEVDFSGGNSVETDYTAGDTDSALLVELYKDRVLYQGEIHDHAANGGSSDGDVPLTDWLTKMTELKMDFAASLDHRQTWHIEHDDWDVSKFIYGTEASTTITNHGNTTGDGEIHYNMLFTQRSQLVNVLNEFDEFNYTADYDKSGYTPTTVGGVIVSGAAFGYPTFEKDRYISLIEKVKEQNGLFVVAHPMQEKTAYYSDNALDFAFLPDYVGFEILYGAGFRDSYTRENYKAWKELLANGNRLWATAGHDGHGDLSDVTLTSVYTDATEKTNGNLVNVLNTGNFTAGSVGIQMCVGSDTAMGSAVDFTGQRVVVDVGELHTSVYDATHKYRVDIINEHGTVYSKMLTINEITDETSGEVTYEAVNDVIAFDAEECDFYRVEVYDVTDDLCIGFGNPIWNEK